MSKAYQAAGNWNDQSLSAEDKRRVEDLSKAYAAAQAAGNKAEMDNLHQQAENIRSGYGYSGGADGSQKIAVSTGGADSVSAQTGGNTGGFTTLPGTSGEVKPENLPLAAGNSTQAVQYAGNGQGGTDQTGGGTKQIWDDGTDYHQDAIDAAKRGDWEGVAAALDKREAKAIAIGTNAGKSNAEIWKELYATYGDTDGTGTKLPSVIRDPQLQDDRINNQYPWWLRKTTFLSNLCTTGS